MLMVPERGVTPDVLVNVMLPVNSALPVAITVVTGVLLTV
jgi:hypothetical protein